MPCLLAGEFVADLPGRYERKGSRFLAFFGLAAVLTYCKKLAKLTT
ncbi:hypothetical protein ACIBVL_37515 [Streptomyces sp. NPDC049687]